MIWKDLQFVEWYDRGQDQGKEQAETDGERFARIQAEAGVNL